MPKQVIEEFVDGMAKQLECPKRSGILLAYH
jgi:hypothetical protein